MSKTIGRVIVVLILTSVLGGLVYLLVNPNVLMGLPPGQTSFALPQPTTTVAKGTVVKQVSGPGESKGSVTEKLKMPKWRYLKGSDVPLNQRVPAGTPLVNFTYGDPFVAPYDLVVLSKNLPKEKAEVTEEHYIEVARVDTMHVVFDVHENDVSHLAEGQSVTVSLGSAEGKTYEGTVVNINQVGTYNATGSKYKATVEIPNDGSILIGMTANVRINVAEAKDVLTVPVSAVVTGKDGSSSVMVQRGEGQQDSVKVELGLANAKQVEIKSGLKEGDTVVLNEATPSQGGDQAGDMAAPGSMTPPPAAG